MSITRTIDAEDCRLWLNDVYGNEWFVGCEASCNPSLEDGMLFVDDLQAESIVLVGYDRELSAESLATMPDIFAQAAVNGLESQLRELMEKACFDDWEDQRTEEQECKMRSFDRGGSDE